MIDCLEKEIERLAKAWKDEMTKRLRNASTEPVYIALIAELLISIEYKLNMSSKL